MDCRLQVSCYGLLEFAVPHSNPVILEAKNYFSVFYSIDGHLQENEDRHS